MIKIENLSFSYGDRGFSLKIPLMEIEGRKKAAFIGESGCGKTTLVYLLSGILKAGEGKITINDTEISGKGDSFLRNFRISNIGFIFQEFELIDYLNVKDNILLPYFVNDSLKLTKKVKEFAEELAKSTGIGDKLDRYPDSLSQGEKQRVAICRSLITRPQILIADEPTGNLDPANATAIMQLIIQQVNEYKTTFLMVTHNHSLLDYFDVTINLGDYLEGGKSE